MKVHTMFRPSKKLPSISFLSTDLESQMICTTPNKIYHTTLLALPLYRVNCKRTTAVCDNSHCHACCTCIFN